jgi:hypothetical protein
VSQEPSEKLYGLLEVLCIDLDLNQLNNAIKSINNVAFVNATVTTLPIDIMSVEQDYFTGIHTIPQALNLIHSNLVFIDSAL